MEYMVKNYGSVDQQLQGALVPSPINANTGNLIHRLNGVGGRSKTKGGDMGAFVAPATLLAMQQLYGRKKSKRGSRRSRRSRRSRFSRSRRYRKSR